ncbi:MAG: hypothetical protein HKP27_00775 [Myxococcales bacterium]|nr:hypothetical protein [Myxococcales bacterium]
MSSWFEPSSPLSAEAEGFRPDPGWASQGPREFASREADSGEQASEEVSPDDPIYQEGFAAGRASAPWTEIESLRALGRSLEVALAEAQALRRAYLTENRRAALELAVCVVEGVLGKELREDAESLEAVVAEAFSEFEPGDELPELFLCEADLDALRALEQGDERRLPATMNCRVDRTLAPGSAELRRASDSVRIEPAEFAERLRERLLPMITRPFETTPDTSEGEGG